MSLRPFDDLSLPPIGEFLSALSSREIGLPKWGLPDDPDVYRLVGRRLGWSSELRSGSSSESPSVLGMIDAARDLLWEIGIHIEVVRAKDDCVVLRCRPRDNVPAQPAFELAKGLVGELPRVAVGVEGTVIETPTTQPTSDICLFTLVWQSLLAPPVTRLPMVPPRPRLRRFSTSTSALLRDELPLNALDAGTADTGTEQGLPAPIQHSGAVPVEATLPVDLERASASSVEVGSKGSGTSPWSAVVTPDVFSLPSATSSSPAGVGSAWATVSGPVDEPNAMKSRPASGGTPQPESLSPMTDHPLQPPDESRETASLSGKLAGVRSRVPWLFRRAWVVIVCIAIVTGAAAVASTHHSTTYTADAILLVNPGASKVSPGSAQEAANLATTYAGLIPSDDSIVRTVASETGLTFDQVQRALTVTVQNGTSLLIVNFAANSPSTALIGANATARAISGSTPVSSAIPAGTVVVAKHATTAAKHYTSGSLVLAIGVILGILLGAVLVIAWERADPRFDHPQQVTAVLGIPARLASELSDASALAIMRQWQIESGSRPTRAAFIAGVSGVRMQVARLGERFASMADRGGMSVSVSSTDMASGTTLKEPQPPGEGQIVGGRQRPGESKPAHGAGGQAGAQSSSDVELLLGGSPGAEGGEAVAQLADVTVLVLPQEATMRVVKRAVATLGELGVTPSWALLSGSRAPSLLHRVSSGRSDGKVAPGAPHGPGLSAGSPEPRGREEGLTPTGPVEPRQPLEFAADRESAISADRGAVSDATGCECFRPVSKSGAGADRGRTP